MASYGSPLRQYYEAVREVPRELRELYDGMRNGNARTLLGLLLESPAELVLGVYHPEDRTVALHSPLEWKIRIGGIGPRSHSFRSRLLLIDVTFAVISLRSMLQGHHRLPFNVWQELVEADGHRVLMVGLVDTKRPLAAAVSAG